MQVVPTTKEAFLEILEYRHKVLLNTRKDKTPGKFKNKNNRAGQTSFVDMILVRGTLMESFGFYQALTHPFAKAAYIMFVTSEVHPSLDGNRRLARVMMNAELTVQNQTTIIIPTVFRDDYLGALRKPSRNHDPLDIRMLSRAQAFSDTLLGDNMKEMEQVLEKSNAFFEDGGRLPNQKGHINGTKSKVAAKNNSNKGAPTFT